jgi:hypothetical protein
MSETEGNWLRGTLTRETQPGLSGRDFLTRLGTFVFKPGDSRWRNAGRIARAGLITAFTGPAGLAAAAGRSAAQGELREGAVHLGRRAWDRWGPDGREAPAGSQTPSQPSPPRGRTWPTDMGPPAPEVVDPNAWGPPEDRANNPRPDPNTWGPPRLPTGGRGPGTRGGEVVGNTPAQQRAAAQALVSAGQDPGMNQRNLAAAARRAMEEMFRGSEK